MSLGKSTWLRLSLQSLSTGVWKVKVLGRLLPFLLSSLQSQDALVRLPSSGDTDKTYSSWASDLSSDKFSGARGRGLVPSLSPPRFQDVPMLSWRCQEFLRSSGEVTLWLSWKRPPLLVVKECGCSPWDLQHPRFPREGEGLFLLSGRSEHQLGICFHLEDRKEPGCK